MHDTINKVRKRVRDEVPSDGAATLISTRFQGAGLSRALSEPLSTHLEHLYFEAHRWLRLAIRFEADAGDTEALGEIYYSSQNIHEILNDLLPFLERAEDNLSEREEITHRESSYEREVTPFSRLDSTLAFRDALASNAAFDGETSTLGAQVEADLLKVIYLEGRIAKEPPKPIDLYAMVVEVGLDGRRHLHPSFTDGSRFMKALSEAASRTQAD
jgi:hypothetical protein